jgi:hypothetical protein
MPYCLRSPARADVALRRDWALPLLPCGLTSANAADADTRSFASRSLANEHAHTRTDGEAFLNAHCPHDKTDASDNTHSFASGNPTNEHTHNHTGTDSLHDKQWYGGRHRIAGARCRQL